MLSGCMVGPNYRTPLPIGGQPVGAFRQSTSTVSQEQPQDDWWRLYRDPKLDALIAQAFAANTDLRVAAANLEAAKAAVDLAKSGRWPTTALSAGAAYGVTSAELARAGSLRRDPTADAILQAGVNVSWEIDLFGRIRRQVEAARADAEASASLRDAVQVEVAAEVTGAYADACAFASAADVQRRSITLAERSARLVEAQADAGAVGNLEVTRAQALTEQSRAGLAPLDAQRRAAVYRLAVLTGQTPETRVDAAERCVAPLILTQSIPTGDGASLIARRPDVRAAERRLAAATARIGVATADLYPTIDLGAAVASLASSLSGLGAVASRTWSVGPLATWLVPNQSAARARIRAARATADADLASFDGSVLTALRDVELALNALAADFQRRDALQAARVRDARAVTLSEQRFGAGATGFLDLLDAQRTLIADDNALALSSQAIGADQVQLFKALGGGWHSGPTA